MDLSTLAVKQKRLKDWTLFFEHEVSDQKLRARTDRALKSYANLLFRCFDKGAVSEHDVEQIDDTERVLEDLSEEARLTITSVVFRK